MAFFKSSYQSRYTKNRFMDKFTNYKRENFNTDDSKYFVVVPEKIKDSDDKLQVILGIYLNVTKFENQFKAFESGNNTNDIKTKIAYNEKILNDADFERSKDYGSSSEEGTLDTPFEIRSTKPLISVNSDEYLKKGDAIDSNGNERPGPDEYIKYKPDELNLGLDSVYYTDGLTFAIKPRFTDNNTMDPVSIDFQNWIRALIAAPTGSGVKTFKDILDEIKSNYFENTENALDYEYDADELPSEYLKDNKFFLLIKKMYTGENPEDFSFDPTAFINKTNKDVITNFFFGQGLEFIGKNNTAIDYDVLGFKDAKAPMAAPITTTTMTPTTTQTSTSPMSTMTPTSTVSTTPAPKKNKFYVKCSNFIPWSNLVRFVNIFDIAYREDHKLDISQIETDKVSVPVSNVGINATSLLRADAIIIYNFERLIKENEDSIADIKTNLNYVIGDSGILFDISSLDIIKQGVETSPKKFVIIGTPVSTNNLTNNNNVPVILHKLADKVGNIPSNRPYGYNIRQRSQGQDDIFINQNAVKNFEPKSTQGNTITNDTLYFSEVLNNTGFHIIPENESNIKFFKKLNENIKKEKYKPELTILDDLNYTVGDFNKTVYHPRNNLLNSLRTNFTVTRPEYYGHQNKVSLPTGAANNLNKNIIQKMIIQDSNYLENTQSSLLVNRLKFRNRYVNTSAFFPRRYGIEGITGYFELLADTAFIAHYKSHQITMIRVLTERILKFIEANLEFIEAVCTVKGFNIEDVISKIIEGNLHDGIEYHCKYFYEDKRKRRILFDENGDPFIHKLTYETDKNGLTIYFIYVFEKKNADKNDVSLSVAESSSGFFDNTMNDSQKFVNLFNEYIDGSVDIDAADINFKNPLNLKWYDTSNGEIIFNDSFLNSIDNKLIHLTDLEELMRQLDNEIEENSEYTNFKNTLYVMINPFEGSTANKTNLKCQYVYYNLCDPSVKQLNETVPSNESEFPNIETTPPATNSVALNQFRKSLFSIVVKYLHSLQKEKIQLTVTKLINSISPFAANQSIAENPGIFIRYPDDQRINKIYSSLDTLVDKGLVDPGTGYDNNNDKETVFNILQTFSKILVPLKKPNTPTTTSS